MQPNQLDSSDVTLVLKHGKEIKARRNDLSAASDFFSALFNSDMRESREGVIRLEHITETVMKTVLEFMRTGDVTERTSENAEDLIEAADYFLLPQLKTIVKSCVKLDLTYSTCISRYCFAEKHLSEDHVAKCRNFIISNFDRVAECHGFLNSEGQQVQQPLNTPENVLKLVLEEFIRSGDAQEVTTENAERLIAAADYFLLPELQTIVKRCVKLDLTDSNCISVYYFAEKHLSEDHVAKCRNFIISNFAEVAKRQEFLNLESHQVERMLQISETVVRLALEFIYSGDATELTSENATDLIEAAKYCPLPQRLKNIVGTRLIQDLTISNCISSYYFAEKHLYEEHVATCRKFVLSNFAAVAEFQEFLSLESQQVEQWICSDELAIRSEEDIFTIIVKWIEQNESERKGKFNELFRHLRVDNISFLYLRRHVATHKLVLKNFSCNMLVYEALRGKNLQTRQRSPRKYLVNNCRCHCCCCVIVRTTENCYEYPRHHGCFLAILFLICLTVIISLAAI